VCLQELKTETTKLIKCSRRIQRVCIPKNKQKQLILGLTDRCLMYETNVQLFAVEWKVLDIVAGGNFYGM